MPIRAIRVIRKMRGGAQAHLIEAADGEHYVVKFTNNPQHRRILVNEWLACSFLRHLQIFVPDTAQIELTPKFIEDNPSLWLAIGSRKEPIPPGVHFGSRLAVHPERVAIFDFLPDNLLEKVENRVDFLGTLLFDKWIGNTDSRQAVFFRARAKKWTPIRGNAPARTGFFAQMIDHGYAFNGPHWTFQDAPLHGMYFRTTVYEGVHSYDSFQPWLDMIENFPVDVIDSAWKQIPSHWLEGDEEELERVLEQLLKRRSRPAQLVAEMRQKRPALFPNWKT